VAFASRCHTGAFTLAAFLALIWFAFVRVGRQRARLERSPVACRTAWALGAALFVHCTNYIGLAYYGQAKFVWYLLLALIASQVAAPARRRTTAARPLPARAGGAARPVAAARPG